MIYIKKNYVNIVFIAIYLINISGLASIIVVNDTDKSKIEVTLTDLQKNACSTTVSLESNYPNIISPSITPTINNGCCINHILVKGIYGNIGNQEINTSLDFCLNEKIGIFKAGSGDMGLSFADVNKRLIKCTKCK